MVSGIPAALLLYSYPVRRVEARLGFNLEISVHCAFVGLPTAVLRHFDAFVGPRKGILVQFGAFVGPSNGILGQFGAI